MLKAILCLLIILSFSFQLEASEKATSVLLTHGFSEEDLVSIINRYPEIKDLDVISTRNSWAPEVDDQSIEIKLFAEKTNDSYLFFKADDVLDVEKIQTTFDIEVKTIEGEIQHNFFDSIMEETNSLKIASQISESFKDEFASSKGRKAKAYYQFQIEQYFDHGQFIKFGNIINASLIIGKAISKKIYQFNPETVSWMLLPEHFGMSEKPFYLPVESLRVTSLFQLNRHHPVTRKFQPHNGIDLGSPSGSTVYPALDGVIVTISRTRSKGKYITIRHDNGYLTTYIHLKKIEKGLRVGDKVELDEKIGEVGRTGYSTGAHLHFGVIQDGYFINPLYLLKRYSYRQRGQHEDAELGIEEKNIVPEEILDEEIEE